MNVPLEALILIQGPGPGLCGGCAVLLEQQGIGRGSSAEVNGEGETPCHGFIV